MAKAFKSLGDRLGYINNSNDLIGKSHKVEMDIFSSEIYVTITLIISSSSWDSCSSKWNYL